MGNGNLINVGQWSPQSQLFLSDARTFNVLIQIGSRDVGKKSSQGENLEALVLTGNNKGDRPLPGGLLPRRFSPDRYFPRQYFLRYFLSYKEIN